jgi:hypothetical protein
VHAKRSRLRSPSSSWDSSSYTLRSISQGLSSCLTLPAHPELSALAALCRAHYHYARLKTVHDRLTGVQPPPIELQELFVTPVNAPTSPAGLAMPNSEGTRLITVVLQLGHSVGSVL